ncbi:MAG: magnesium and cobalt exporter, family [Verrucomicrobiota bacterium]|jgi:CBS domain containing-hemolysin-like protein
MNTLWVGLFTMAAGISFVMSGMEAGVFALNRLRIRHRMREGNRRAAALYGYLERPENFLWTILVGNTLANLAAVSIGVMWLDRWLHDWPWVLLLTLITGVLLFYGVCELLPKMLFRLYPNRLCLAMALPFGLLRVVFKPVVAVMAVFTRWLLRWTGGRRFTGRLFGNRDELRRVMQESAQGLTTEERTMINRVLDLQNLSVQRVTIPLALVATVSADDPLSRVLALAREQGFSRFPVWKKEGGRRRIAGLVSLPSLLREDLGESKRTVGEFLRPALYLDEDLRLEIALRQMQRSGHRLAIVLGQDRREIGIVCLQDILQVIFGEVRL